MFRKGNLVLDFIKKNIPSEEESIKDVIDIEQLSNILRKVKIYYRTKDKCPFRKGNLVLDFILDNGQIFCLKFPLETTKLQIKNYLSPLEELVRNKFVISWNLE